MSLKRAAKRTLGFEEALAEHRGENLGSPGGVRDLIDAIALLNEDVAEIHKSVERLHRQTAQLWEALNNEGARRKESVDDLREMLDRLELQNNSAVSRMPESQRSVDPTSVLGQLDASDDEIEVIDLTTSDSRLGPTDAHLGCAGCSWCLAPDVSLLAHVAVDEE
jgi:predicted nuclease with TOPRIM domain